MIQLSNVQKKYANHRVLTDVSVSLSQGKTYGLLGGNGVGKSTLIKSVMKFLQIDAGSIDIQGRLAYLPEQPYLPENISAWQLVSLACKMQACAAEEVAELLQEVGLDAQAWHKKISGYSKGMRQRTAIAYALAGSPEWLILDEPMSGLDAMGRMLILNVLKKRHAQGAGILMCSHIVTDMVRLCDVAFVMAEGAIKEEIQINNESLAQADILESRLRHWSKHETMA
ncbi:MAG: ABC transporter ATP-binding protein [Ghiorsea sp.]